MHIVSITLAKQVIEICAYSLHRLWTWKWWGDLSVVGRRTGDTAFSSKERIPLSHVLDKALILTAVALNYVQSASRLEVSCSLTIWWIGLFRDVPAVPLQAEEIKLVSALSLLKPYVCFPPTGFDLFDPWELLVIIVNALFRSHWSFVNWQTLWAILRLLPLLLRSKSP